MSNPDRHSGPEPASDADPRIVQLCRHIAALSDARGSDPGTAVCGVNDDGVPWARIGRVTFLLVDGELYARTDLAGVRHVCRYDAAGQMHDAAHLALADPRCN